MADIDVGLIGGLADGLKAGMGAYQDQMERKRRIAQYEADQKMKKVMLDIDLAKSGYKQEEAGGLIQDTSSPAYFQQQAGFLDKGIIKDEKTGLPALSDTKKREQIAEISLKEAQAAKARKEAKEPNKRTDPELKAATDLRKEYQARPEIKNFNDVSTQYRKIKQAAKNPSAAGDLSLIFSYMKMLDPGSTVREGEFANAQNAAGVPDQIVNLYNRAKSGERLNPNQRLDFQSQAERLYGSHLASKDAIDAEFGDLSARYGVDPGLVYKKGGLIDSETQFPIQVRKDGKTAIISNEKELKEAQKEGWQ